MGDVKLVAGRRVVLTGIGFTAHFMMSDSTVTISRTCFGPWPPLSFSAMNRSTSR